MAKTAVSFSYDGYHRKSNALIDPIQHLQMLIAAIDVANPKGEHDVIVAAIGFDIWSMTEGERMLAWEVYRRARIVVSRNHPEDHQHGASWAIRMATEAASSIGADFLVHLAEDILLAPDAVEYFVEHLADYDYVGSWWGNTEYQSLNTQVFGCRVAAFADLKSRRFVIDPHNPSPHAEGRLWQRVTEFRLRFLVGPPWNYPGREGADVYFHTHDVAKFREEYERRGFTWREHENCGAKTIEDRFSAVCRQPSDINEHCMTLFGLAREVKRITECGHGQTNSMTAFLAANPDSLTCYEFEVNEEARRLERLSEGRMKLFEAKSAEVTLEDTDLLFLDTTHTYNYLSVELERHASKVRRWIVLHDTTIFGDRGEDGGEGLWKAITEFLNHQIQWRLKSRVHYNNGLTILERSS